MSEAQWIIRVNGNEHAVSEQDCGRIRNALENLPPQVDFSWEFDDGIEPFPRDWRNAVEFTRLPD